MVGDAGMEQRRGVDDREVVRWLDALAGRHIRERVPEDDSPHFRANRCHGAHVEERQQRGQSPDNAQRRLRLLRNRRRPGGHWQHVSRLHHRPRHRGGSLHVGRGGGWNVLGGEVLPGQGAGQLQGFGIPDPGDARLERGPPHGRSRDQPTEGRGDRGEGAFRPMGPRLPGQAGLPLRSFWGGQGEGGLPSDGEVRLDAGPSGVVRLVPEGSRRAAWPFRRDTVQPGAVEDRGPLPSR